MGVGYKISLQNQTTYVISCAFSDIINLAVAPAPITLFPPGSIFGLPNSNQYIESKNGNPSLFIVKFDVYTIDNLKTPIGSGSINLNFVPTDQIAKGSGIMASMAQAPAAIPSSGPVFIITGNGPLDSWDCGYVFFTN